MWAAAFAETLGASLTVACALAASPPGGAPCWYENEWIENSLPGAVSRAEVLVHRCGTKARVLVDEGDPAKVLTGFARSDRAGLLVIGRAPGECGAGRLSNEAYAIVRHAPVPVVSV